MEKQKVELSRLGAHVFLNAIDTWIYRNVVTRTILLPAQILAVRHLNSITKRLNSKLLLHTLNCSNKPILFSLSVEEIVSVQLTIQHEKDNPALLKVLGDIHQRSLNFNQLAPFSP